MNTLESLEAICKGANDDLRSQDDPPVDVVRIAHEAPAHEARIKNVKEAELETQDGLLLCSLKADCCGRRSMVASPEC